MTKSSTPLSAMSFKGGMSLRNGMWHELQNSTIYAEYKILTVIYHRSGGEYFANHLRVNQSARAESTIHLCGIY